MVSQAEQFDREAVLMLYLADEMAPPQRQAFEQRLAADAALAADLAALRAAQEVAFAALDHADRQTRLPVGEGAAVRRVSRAIQQWHARRVKPASEPARRGLPLPWWCYPAAAAASIITAFLVWSSRQEVGPTDPVVSAAHFAGLEEDELANWMDSSLAYDEGAWGGSAATEDAILGVPLTPSRTVDLSSIFMMPPAEETIQ